MTVEGRFQRLPLPVKSALKAAERPVDPLVTAAWRRRTGDQSPIPPMRLRARIGAGADIDFFLRSGRSVTRALTAGLADAGRPIDGFADVLDFGAGCGRVTRHVADALAPASQLWACDVDGAAIRWARSHHPAIVWEQTAFVPPLPFADGAFDLVYSISIFTHLPPEDQNAWLGELARVLHPGGTAALTTATRPDAEDDVVFEAYRRRATNNADFSGIGRDRAYGLTFNTREDFTARAEPWFAALDFRRGAINAGQDLHVFVRR